MPAGKRRSLRRSGPVLALGFVCLAGVVPISFAASSPAPDPPPLAVAPDPQPAEPVKVPPPRPREAPAVVQAPAVQSVAPVPVATSAPAPVVKQPAVAKKPARRAPRPGKKQQVVQKAVVSPPHSLPRDVWPVARAGAAVPTAEALQRRRFALAGVALALVAVGGGVLLGVGHWTLKEATS